MSVCFYMAKYVNKKSDMDLAAIGFGAKEWNNSLKTKLSLLLKKLIRIRMSRNFGMKMLTMTNLSTECLIQLTKLGYDATPFNQILKHNFFFQAEDGIRDYKVTGVQTCALPIFMKQKPGQFQLGLSPMLNITDEKCSENIHLIITKILTTRASSTQTIPRLKQKKVC